MKDAPSLRDLIISVGTHRSNRLLSPLEVADAIVFWSNELGLKECLQRISLGESTARRFLRLRELEPKISSLVGWGRQPGTIPFASASELARLNSRQEREELATAAVKHGLTKEEVRQAVQLRLRGGVPMSEAIAGALRMRPTVDTINVFIGGVTSAEASDRLSEMSQQERDEVLVRLLRLHGYAQHSGRLTPHNFTIVGPEPVPPHAAVVVEEQLNTIHDWSTR